MNEIHWKTLGGHTHTHTHVLEHRAGRTGSSHYAFISCTQSKE